MRKLNFILFMLLATATGAKAATYTSVDDLTKNKFMLVNTQGMAAYFYSGKGQNDIKFGAPELVKTNSDFAYLFQAEKVLEANDSTFYRIAIYYGGDDAKTYDHNGGPYLNIQPKQPDHGVVFCGGCKEDGNHKYGQDWNNGGLWYIDATDGGFTFRNRATHGYLGFSGFNYVSTAITYTCATADTYTDGVSTATTFTTVEQLTGNLFTIGTNGKLVCHTTNNDAHLVDESEASAMPDRLYKAQKVTVDGNDYYRIACYSVAGGAVTVVDDGAYLNTQACNGLFYGSCDAKQKNNKTYGQDVNNDGLWTIEYSTENNGFTFKNVGTSRYMNGTGTNETATYFTCKSRFTDQASTATYTRTVTDGNYLTLCLPYAATITGATVYEFKGVDKKDNPTAAYIEEYTGEKTEAGKPYILKATSSTVTATLDETSVAAVAGSNNGLVGTFAGQGAVKGTYVLSNNQWLLTVDGDLPTVGANRAWLNLEKATVVTTTPAAAKGIAIGFGNGTVTAISGVEKAAEGDGAVYNLQGVRVSHPTKGIYIKNGKKYIVK